MKIATYASGKNLSFGRLLTPDEANRAYQTALQAREAMGYKDGKSVLLLPSDKLPEANSPTLKAQLDSFFAGVKNLLGINSVEVTSQPDAGVELTLNETLKQQGIKRIFPFARQDADKLEEAVKTAAKDADGLRILDAHEYSKEQLDLIETTFKAVKGDSFDPGMLMYEHGGGNGAYRWDGNGHIDEKFSGKIIVGSSHYVNDGDGLWGSTSFYTDRMGAKQGEFIHGLRKMEQQTLKDQMADMDQVNKGSNLLKSELNIFDYDLSNPARFAAAKRGDVVMSQHLYRHFDDITPGHITNLEGFESVYHQALLEGTGDNYFDSLAKVMHAKGLDKTHPELYERVCGFRNVLYAPGNLATMSSAEIEESYRYLGNVVTKNEHDKQLKILAKEYLEKVDPLDGGIINKSINLIKRNKKLFAVIGTMAGLGAIGATMYSYGKENTQKLAAGQPKSEKLDKQA